MRKYPHKLFVAHIIRTKSSKNNENVITPAAVSKLPQTPPDELILPPILVPQLQVATKPSSTIDEPLHLETNTKSQCKRCKI